MEQFEIIRVGLVCMKVCAHKSLTDKQVEDLANTESPTGISSTWQIDRDQINVRCQCNDHPTHEHLILNC